MTEVKKFFVTNNRLNKGHAGSSQMDQRGKNFYVKKFEHLLPPVEMMAEYEYIYPGTLKKLIEMSENEQRHIHQLNVKNAEISKQVAYNEQIFSRIYSLLFFLFIAITTIVLTMLGNYCAASIFATIGFIVSIRVFICKKFNILERT